MRTIHLFIILFLISCTFLQAQEYKFFHYEESENSIFLRPNQVNALSDIDNHEKKGVQQLIIREKMRFYLDMVQIIRTVFKDSSEADINLLQNLHLFISIRGDGHCFKYYFLGPKEELNNLFKLEDSLFELGEKLQAIDYSVYDFYLPDQQDKMNNEALYSINFRCLKKK